MEQTWVVVADSARARFFEYGRDRTLEEFDTLVAPDLRLHERDLASDRPGRTYDSRGGGRHAMEPRHKVREHEAEVFARQLAAHIEDARIAGYLEKLVLIAPPKFLGLLRASLDANTAAMVVHSIDKELSSASAEEVAEHLPRIF